MPSACVTDQMRAKMVAELAKPNISLPLPPPVAREPPPAPIPNKRAAFQDQKAAWLSREMRPRSPKRVLGEFDHQTPCTSDMFALCFS